MIDETINFLKGSLVNFKAHLNHDNSTYSLGVKTPIEALPITNKLLVRSELSVSLSPDIEKTVLAIKNNSNQNINLRLATFSMAVTSNSAVSIKIKSYDSTVVNGTYLDYDETQVSQYSLNSTSITDIPNVGYFFGTVILGNSQSRINLFKDDAILRWGAGETLVINAKCKNSADLAFFIRHIEEF